MLYLIRIAGGILVLCHHAYRHGMVGDSTSLENEARQWDGRCGDGMGMIFGPAIGGLLSTISLSFPLCSQGFAWPMLFPVWLWLPESLAVEQRVVRKIERASLLKVYTARLWCCLDSICQYRRIHTPWHLRPVH